MLMYICINNLLLQAYIYMYICSTYYILPILDEGYNLFAWILFRFKYSSTTALSFVLKYYRM